MATVWHEGLMYDIPDVLRPGSLIIFYQTGIAARVPNSYESHTVLAPIPGKSIDPDLLPEGQSFQDAAKALGATVVYMIGQQF